MIQTKNESGRSLLEMLAVVSIMGVLVVGAMSALRFGTVSMQVSSVYSLIENAAAGIADLYSWNRTYPEANEAKKMAERIAHSGDVVEGCRYVDNQLEGCQVTNSGLKVELPFGLNGNNQMLISPDGADHFKIELPTVPKDVCLRLNSMQWTYAEWHSPADCSAKKIGKKEYVEGITFYVY